ncbi:uracil-DNA glycosylase family protein [Sphingomonas sp. KR1UV-12]|uniref:Uracil-DNA glycosylase family protein n=1 Tax=Sphingomonas aurea TaxID=3063994 RepID=A0ABT9EGX5_9SPHN|nr:uracil-DNA glycosylase family protein [Sphingomonas sp. KR1UV-12]MDP1026214.1 uracil-DNA glycosylase family protein [Sphingomonas sp. KR1UV-12]
MGAYQTIDPAHYASTLDWWRDAGVDVLVEDAVRDWLALAPAALPPVPAAAPAEQALPETLAAFAAWRAGADAPEAGWSGVSVAASGPADARVMVLVDCPEREDGDAGALLSGPGGRLLDRMLAAIGLSRETVHLAAICARRPAAGRMPRDVEARLGEIARHHVALVAPERLLLLGDATSRAVLSADRQAVRGSLQPFHHKKGTTGVMASLHPCLLIERPALKAESWRDLRMLVAGMGMDEREERTA